MQRFAELVADTGPQNYTDDGFGVHLAFFNRTPAEARMRILEGRRRQVEERREGLREAVARASSSLDRYTRQLHQLGLESSEREVKWLNELIAAERVAQGHAELNSPEHYRTRSSVGEGERRHEWQNDRRTEVRVAIVGVGNCASSLVQGVQYYHDADENSDGARPDARASSASTTSAT